LSSNAGSLPVSPGSKTARSLSPQPFPLGDGPGLKAQLERALGVAPSLLDGLLLTCSSVSLPTITGDAGTIKRWQPGADAAQGQGGSGRPQAFAWLIGALPITCGSPWRWAGANACLASPARWGLIHTASQSSCRNCRNIAQIW